MILRNRALAEWLTYNLKKTMSYDLSLLSLVTHNNCLMTQVLKVYMYINVYIRCYTSYTYTFKTKIISQLYSAKVLLLR